MRSAGGAGGGLEDQPPGDVPAALRDYQRLELEREGIGMFLVVHDARPGRRLRAADDAVRAEGGLLRSLYDHYSDRLDEARPLPFPEDDLVPTGSDAPDDPTGAREVIEALAVLSDHHLTRRTSREDERG